MNHPHFSKEVALRDGVKTFYFYRLPAGYPSYRVEVETGGEGRLQFSMFRPAAGGWRVTGHRLPLWVAEAESELASALEVQDLSG